MSQDNDPKRNRAMTLRKVVFVLGALIAFGLGCVLSGVLEALGIVFAPEHLWPVAGVFFVFGVAAGFVFVAKHFRWFGIWRNSVCAVAGAIAGAGVAILLSGTPVGIAATAAVFFALFYFGEHWVEHI
jgi:hypothetical protein